MNTLPNNARRTATIGPRQEWSFPAVAVIVDGQPGIAYLATTRGEDVTDVQVRMDDAPDGDAAVWMPAHRVRLA